MNLLLTLLYLSMMTTGLVLTVWSAKKLVQEK